MLCDCRQKRQAQSAARDFIHEVAKDEYDYYADSGSNASDELHRQSGGSTLSIVVILSQHFFFFPGIPLLQKLF